MLLLDDVFVTLTKELISHSARTSEEGKWAELETRNKLSVDIFLHSLYLFPPLQLLLRMQF